MSRETLLPRPEWEKISLTSSPCAPCDTFCGGTDLTSSPSGITCVRCNDANRFAKLSKRSGCTVSTMVLSEARGLRLYRVIRGGIGLSQRLGAGGTMSTGHTHTHPRTRASRRTGWSSSARIGERQRFFRRDAQAACCFSFSASKLSPFFQSVSVIAAILRARVRRAMAGFMPFASNPR
jgi:hypothetical protein